MISNPNPSNPYGNQKMGHSALGLILPYIEQGVLANITDINKSVIDPANLPPPLGTTPAGGTRIPIYVCPSTPDRTVDYQPYFSSVGFPNLGPMLSTAMPKAAHRELKRLDLTGVVFNSEQLQRVLTSRCLKRVEELRLGRAGAAWQEGPL